MCLSSIDNKKKRVTVGYKVFDFSKNQFGTYLKPSFRYMYGSYPINGWIYDKKDEMIGWGDCRYSTGFHFYLTKEDALVNCYPYERVRKIIVRDVVCTGTQNSFSVGVAKGMLITDEEFSNNGK